MSDPWLVGFLSSLGAALICSLSLTLLSRRVRAGLLRTLLRLSGAGLNVYYTTQRAAGTALVQTFREANEIRILAVRAWSLFPVVMEVTQLGELVAQKGDKCNVRVLLLSPFTEQTDREPSFIKLREAELDKITPRDAAGLALVEQVRMTLRVIADLKEKGLNCTVRLYNEFPVFKIIVFDHVAFVGGFSRNNVGRNNPMYQVRRNEGLLFDLADRYFEYIWEHRSEPFDLERISSLRVAQQTAGTPEDKASHTKKSSSS